MYRYSMNLIKYLHIKHYVQILNTDLFDKVSACRAVLTDTLRVRLHETARRRCRCHDKNGLYCSLGDHLVPISSRRRWVPLDAVDGNDAVAVSCKRALKYLYIKLCTDTQRI